MTSGPSEATLAATALIGSDHPSVIDFAATRRREPTSTPRGEDVGSGCQHQAHDGRFPGSN